MWNSLSHLEQQGTLSLLVVSGESEEDWLQKFSKLQLELDVSIPDHAVQLPGFYAFLLFLLHSQTQVCIKDIFGMSLAIKQIPAGDASKEFHLCEVPGA